MTPEDLVEIERIRQLKARYLRAIDTKDWDLLASVLAPEATAAYSGGKYSFSGRDEIIGFIRRGMGREDFLSSHRCSHPEITVADDRRSATGTWALEDYVIIGEHDLVVHGAAFYDDRYEQHDGEWLIVETGYRRSFEQIWPRSSIEGLTLTASWWGTDGQSSLPAV